MKPRQAAAVPATVSTAPFDGKTTHEFDHFSFTVPAGWVVVTPDLDLTRAMIMQGGNEWPNAKAMIKIDTQAPNTESPKSMVEVFSTNTAGTVADEPVDFGGTPGYVATASEALKTGQRNLVALFRDDLAYTIVVNSADGVKVDAALETVRSSWKWKNPEKKAAEGEAGDAKAEEGKTGEAKADEGKAGDAKAGGAKAGDAKAGDAKAAEEKKGDGN